MTAEEMFKGLNYKKEKDADERFSISYKKTYVFGRYSIINFDVINKGFSICFYDSNGDLCTPFVSVNALTAIYKQAEELGWIESGPKQETNYEHYKEDISKLFIDNLAVVNGKPKKCNNTDCDRDCDLCSTCDKDTYHELLINWLNQPYKEPTYKLTQFEYDLLRTNTRAKDKTLNNFDTYKNLRSVGYFRGIDFDLKIEDILANCEVIR